jgi:hypothetical protein
MSTTPWNSIAESVTIYEERRLSYTEALTSPCASCGTAPCCTHLPLHTFKITNMIELDHAVYMLNFERILLGLSASGEWSIYYTYPCRFLHRQNFSCTVHNSPTQPKICIHYNPYSCWYKRVLTKSVSDEFLQIDRSRMEYILARIVFDEFRNIVEVPDWASLIEELASLPLESAPPGSDPPDSDPVMEQWQELIIRLDNGNEVEPNNLYSYDTSTDPCSNCQAHCCQTLIFPQSLPRNMTNLDYYKFCLGFPGVELALADDVWSIVIKTTCRHLQGHRCGVYGQPERPLLCKYYDAWKCTYRINFGLPRPPGFMRVRLEQFDWLAECFQFDQHGAIAQFPSTSAIRSHIEERWRDTLTSPVVQAAPVEI